MDTISKVSELMRNCTNTTSPSRGACGQIGLGTRHSRSSTSIRITGTSTNHVNIKWPERVSASTNGEKPNSNPPSAAGR